MVAYPGRLDQYSGILKARFFRLTKGWSGKRGPKCLNVAMLFEEKKMRKKIIDYVLSVP